MPATFKKTATGYSANTPKGTAFVKQTRAGWEWTRRTAKPGGRMFTEIKTGVAKTLADAKTAAGRGL